MRFRRHGCCRGTPRVPIEGLVPCPAREGKGTIHPRHAAPAMARISTGTGDDGTTGLVGGQRVSKADPRVEAVGAVDEANDALGLAVAFSTRSELQDIVRSIQADLFTVGADLAGPEGASTLRVTRQMVDDIVRIEDALEAKLPPLTHFILPGGTPTAAYLQLARSIVRRAERQAWAVAAREPVTKEALVYLNRLSDLLFLLAREDNVLARKEETQWMGKSRGA